MLLLDDIAAQLANTTVIQYDCSDYELPLLASNQHYRCALSTEDRPLRQDSAQWTPVVDPCTRCAHLRLCGCRGTAHVMLQHASSSAADTVTA